MSSKAGENNYTDSMKGISTDRFSLEYFITNDLLYVDKTMYAYELVSSADKNFFFVSRPRRFGTRSMPYSRGRRIYSRVCI